MKKTVKKLIIITSIILVCIFLFIVNQKVGGSQSAVKTTIGKVDKGDVTQTVLATGQIEPGEKIKARVEVEGNVLEKKAKEGDVVKKGDILLVVDQTKLKNDLLNAEIKLKRLENNLKNLKETTGPSEELSAKNNYEKSKIAMDYAVKNLETMRRMFKEEIITRRQLEEAERNLDTSKLDYQAAEQQLKTQKETFAKSLSEANWEIELAQADLKEAKRKLDEAIVRAPISGTIVEDILKEKRYVGFGEEIFSIGDVSRFDAKVKVDELDISKVKIGQPALISSEAFKDVKLEGHVTEIASQATRETFAQIEVTLQIDDTHQQPVRPNLSVDAEIQVEKSQQYLRVPVEAITKKDGKTYVFVIEKNKAHKREVTIGVANQKYIAVLKGLKEGEEVALKNLDRLKDNAYIQKEKVKK
jgi:HlyD family secretion protein/macrolide-specific efflux system membrane fusion protein